MDTTITCIKDVEQSLDRALQTHGISFDPFENSAIRVIQSEFSDDHYAVLIIIDKNKIDIESAMWKESFYKFNLAMKSNGINLADSIYGEPDDAYLIYSAPATTFY